MKAFLCLFALLALACSQSSTCSVCEFVVKAAEGLLQNQQTEEEILQIVEKACEILPGQLAQECTDVVEAKGPAILKALIQGAAPESVCTYVGCCAASKRAVANVQQGGCSVCELVVQYVEGYLAQNQTEQQIITQLEQECAILGPLNSTCYSFVEQYVPQLIQWLEAGESPQQFCTQIGLCAAPNRPVESIQQSEACQVCQWVVSYVESYIAQNQTEQQIIQQLDQVCSLLGPLANECDSFVQNYVPQLIQYIEAGENPLKFCGSVGLCSSTKRAVVEVEQGGCSVCELVVSYVESYIAQNQTEQQIIQQLDQVCSLLGPLANECDSFVQNYVPQLIQWIESGETPVQFCTQVGLCSAQKRSVQQGGCSVCQLVVTYVETYLASNKSIVGLEEELEALCSILGQLSATCDNFVTLYTPQLVQWIVSNEPPQQFCAQVGLCSTPPQRLQKPRLSVKSKSGPRCSICETIVQYVELYVASQSTEDEIVQGVEQLCTFLPANYQKACDNFVEVHLEDLIQYMIQEENPATFCSQAGLC